MQRSKKNANQLLIRQLSHLYLIALVACQSPQVGQVKQVSDTSGYTKFTTEHQIIGHLGSRHLANLVYRQTDEGPKLVGWGREPITEWPVGSASKKQVVESNPDHRYSNGGCAMDLDDDGEDEIIVARGAMSNLNNAQLMWFDEVEGKRYWQGHIIASIWESGYSSPHDIKPYVFQTDSGTQKAVIANKSRREIFLFLVPEDLEGNWKMHRIGSFPMSDQSGVEVVDINGDGRNDIVSGIYWIEAPADPANDAWVFHQYGQWDDANRRWGGMNQHGIADFDGDGTLEIIASEAEIPDARLSLFKHENGDLENPWQEIPIDSGLNVPHSLVVLNLNQDDLPDMLVGEMTAGGWNFPMNPNPRIYAYINRGGQQFDKQIFSEGWGVHEMKLAPNLYQGKMMVYAADEIQPQKFSAMNTHVSHWLIDKK